jgi:hypothetical protein
MATTTRQVIVGKTVVLEIDVRDARGNSIDPDSQPRVSIIDSHGVIRRAMSNIDVVRIQEGRFRFAYAVPLAGPTGIWIDHWQAVVNGFTTDARLNFIVLTASADIEVSGAQIGDDCTTTYSNEEILGINCLLGALKARLKNDLEIESLDAYGNTTYEACPVFTDEELVWFLNCSLSEFNQTPHFTDFTFDMEVIYKRFSYIIIEGAFILATAAQMLIEAGREFTISDNGITLNPPPLSSILNNELSVFVTRHTEMLKFIKNSIKPYPSGFGNFRALAISPNYARLRHLRQRRII